MTSPARLEAIKKATAASAAKKRARTHCKRGHPLFGPNVYVRTNGGRACKMCATLSHRKTDANMPKQEKIVQVLAALREGRTKDSITKRRKIINFLALKTLLNSDHEEAPAIAALIERNRNISFQSRCGKPTAPHANLNHWLMTFGVAAVDQAVSGIPDYIRDEIKNELLAQLWTGEVAPSNIAVAVKKLQRQMYKDYELFSKFSNHVSLDAVLHHDGTRTLHDFQHRSIWEYS
ncbi:hypothetical protein [Nitrobacter winogradskyi]|uniref:Uncharacterized protein n=3 Tax=Nitrobacter winogradskyi TaxID=913 RepID=A0ACC6AER4_NITWI|nr:hypothetical protein [Nitrobacter winogradskyi]MCP1998224.1 hypothetical protein [Nitrobacter winogradskyi]GEC15188.1 hypothetical protein NWI01_10800 [Nitrobacter winogradskyi]